MGKKEDYSGILVDLDVLLDTRLATLFELDPENVKYVFDSDHYFRRVQDSFPKVDKETFRAKYDSRNVSWLKNAPQTPIVALVQEFVINTIKQEASTPFGALPKVYLNIAPYQLSEVAENKLIKTFAVLTNGRCDIELVSYNVEDLHPRLVKEKFSVMVMYDYYKWIEHFSANEVFKKVTCPEVSLIGPQLYFERLPTSQELKQAELNKLTIFQATERFASPFINLCLIPVKDFSVNFRLKKNSA